MKVEVSNKKLHPWKNRIIGHGEKPAKEFNFNPDNWRIHSDIQKSAISSVLSEIGWVTGVIESKNSGLLMDGHARVAEALKLGPETIVPFVLVDLSPEEEKKILAVLDPIGDLASADHEKLQEILSSIQFNSADLFSVVETLLPMEIFNEIEKSPNLENSDFDYQNKFGVIVECEDELHQQTIFDRLSKEGLKCKVVVV